MQKSRKTTVGRLLSLALVASLAGCGGADAGPNPTTSISAPGATTTATTMYGPLSPNEKVLLGPDANGNGVRDEVDAWIAATFADPATRTAATTVAQWQTWAMIRGVRGTPTTTDELNSWGAAMSCLYDTSHGAMGDAAPSVNTWKAELFNTYLRTKAYLSWSASIDGMSTSTSDAPCNDIKPMTTP